MNERRQREEAAKIEGWLIIGHAIGLFQAVPPNELPLSNKWLTEELATNDFPDYPNDFNAVHRLIAGMDSLVFTIFADLLYENMFERIPTCSQMLEYVLRAYGVWEES